MTDHLADIASKRTPGPREAWQDALPMLDKALNEVWHAAHPDAAQYLAERMYEDGWNISRVEAANTYDELLAVAEAARRLVDNPETIRAGYLNASEYTDLRAALAALDAAQEKEGHRG